MKKLSCLVGTLVLTHFHISTLAAQEKLPPGTKLVRVEARPGKIELKNPYAYAQLLLTGILDNGTKVDVTRMAKIDLPEKLVKVSPQGQVRPLADGKGQVKFTVEGQSGVIPITVSGQQESYPVSFVRDVMPTLSRMGCNAGTCHGSAQGKNGFQLSLRGYDPVFDHRALIDDIGGRRFNRAAPDKSLMLLKTSGAVPHVGGVLTQPGEPRYELLRAWIAQGVKLDLEAPRVTKVEVYPSAAVLPLPGMKQQMTVTAIYSNGATRDVTAEAFIDSSNTEVATVEKQGGLVTAVRRGETAMLARYEGNYAAATLLVMGDRTGFAWQPVPEFNYIDALVYDKLKEVKIQPSELCADSEFNRRLHLDLTGLPPDPEAVRAFLADPRPSKVKREELVDKLVGSPDFVEHWTNKWADLLQVNRKFLGEPGAKAFREYIRKAVADNKPYDKFCYELLTAKGSNMENPAASYFKILRDPAEAMENTTHLFLAVRFNCNKCHDHPFERWTQNQYYTLASYFAQIGRQEDPKFKGQRTEGSAVRGPLPLVEIISDINAGEVKSERTGENAKPEFPYVHAAMPPVEKMSRREQLARWITAKDNPYFAKSYANRVWSYLLGVGIIEPIDDIRAGNPPTNPKLLERLTEEFIKSNFNVQALIKTICKSRTYQHSIVANKWNQDDDVNYSRAIAKRLPAEVLYDAIHRATGAQSKLPGLPVGARAAQLLDSSEPVPGSFLELFGRPPRESACECERSNQMLLGPVLNLVNGPVLADALRDPNNRINKLLASQADDAKVVEELYLAILCRRPSADELKLGVETLRDNDREFVQLVNERKRRQAELAVHEKRLPELQAQWEASVTRSPVWTVLEPVEMRSLGGAALTREKDNSIFLNGPNPTPESYTIIANTNLTSITGVRLEVLSDKRLPAKGPGRAPNGNFVLNEFKVSFAKKLNQDESLKRMLSVSRAFAAQIAAPTGPTLGHRLASLHALERASANLGRGFTAQLTRPQATVNQDGFAINGAIDNNPGSGWAIGNGIGKNQTAVFEVVNHFGFQEGTTLTIVLDQQFPGRQHNIGKFRLAVTNSRPPVLLQGQTPANITKILDVPKDKRTPEQLAALANYYRTIDPALGGLERSVNEFIVPATARALGAQDLAWALINSPAFLFNH